MAKLQIAAGAVGLTTAKVGEAIVMAEAHHDLFIAYPAIDPWRCERLAKLAATNTVRVGFDSGEAADALGAAAKQAGVTIGALIDLDVGLHRTGVQSPADALALAQHVSNIPGLRLDGIMCYPGQLKEPAADQQQLLEPVSQLLEETLDLWRRSGLQARIVSGGSTPTAYQTHHVRGVTEIRPGTYIYNDMNTVSCGYVALEDCAARMTCTVISTAVPDKFVIDAGSKSLTQDRRSIDPDTAGFGHVVEYPDAKIVRLSEEHGEVDASRCSRRPKVGERVHVIPNHVCPCVNLQTMVWLRDDSGVLEPMGIDARGMVW
jgi:D-serine deaminase-like pyridoxal phosphate-dependent protein